MYPSPAASAYGSSQNGSNASRPKAGTPSLETWAAKNWPTPQTTDAASAGRHTTKTGVMHSGTTLTDAMRMWPTPRASEGEARTHTVGPTHGKRHGRLLGGDAVVAAQSMSPDVLLGHPDPTTETAGGGTSLPGQTRPPPFRLNPVFVEALVGLSLGWTCLCRSTRSGAPEATGSAPSGTS